MFLAQIFGKFREETRFLMSQEKRDRPTKKPGFLFFQPKFLVNSEKKPGFSYPKKSAIASSTFDN
ncbi:hypothetical protein [Planktothricoides raciborskii]|uniref:Uncharacterized protein n=2 Tax=Planktothricoides raciborskii TaxID=132608 RepID=A0AAU8JGL7_9CYAN|nr:hypothetical protein [Planktothricoides raciborskii]MBD2545235.1 hypothetical protein [Planktothricoides raciborskii FACHB-1370]MBD2584446.1 hypothetical protein [Planktothricoides raciborskii FACHB-1261]